MEFQNIERSFRSKNVCTLSRFSDGLYGTIVDVIGDADLQGKLMGMGLFVGTRFQLFQRGTLKSRIPFLLAVSETRIALGWELADKILVEE